MRELLLIRHGMTKGNREQRYIGVTDDPLLPESIETLKTRSIAPVQRLFCSPLTRCRQTASSLFPGMLQEILEDLRECDFGHFENRNYIEMAGDPEYQAFIDSNATLPFPGGESREDFQKRSLSALDQILLEMERDGIGRAACVTHGGTIMSILEACGRPQKKFYEWHPENGGGYLCLVDPSVRPALLHVVDDADVTNEFTLRK